MVDCKITTHNIDKETVFVITGFEKGMKMHDGFYAQGRCILRVYRLEEGDKPLKLMHSRVLTDFKFNYLNLKNTKPLAYNGDNVYYFVFENNFDHEKLTVSRTFYKCDLRKCAYKEENDDKEIETKVGNGRTFTEPCF